ncbi:MAG TPA: efflux RND transporter periplasmic adaptor subunit [Ignavibacteria bacterium]|nr:efflux RND transporter periplasmic adaptor subunit [Bacteroidota bacterium]HRI84248.1 efflux RND transporter periplasmic adaptor subunit [Ignavibacteria bacterium]HRJ99062.1 efflux RND transporter periplasmic adaptor subunit [Ignavibacteria bacterium]
MKNIVFIAAIIFSVLITGCSRESHNDISEGDNEGELDALVYTLYSDKTELFVEFKPLIAGNLTKFAAHFTHLVESFKAYTEGTVTLRLKTGDKEISVITNSPSSPGIFRLELTPEMQGKGQLIFDIQTEFFLDQIIIDNVTVYPSEEAAFFDQTEEPDVDEITFLKEQAWKIDFANQLLIRQSFNEVVKTSGQITSAPGDESVIVAKSQGIVKIGKGNATAGARVNSGELLFTVKGSDVIGDNIDVRFEEVKLNYEKALADYERGKELVKDNIISLKEFLEREIELKNAEIIYNNISTNYSGDGENVYSPMSGYIKNILVSDGQYVAAGQQLGSVSKNRKLLLTAEISQQYFSRLGKFTSANFRTEYDNQVYRTADLNGTLVSFGRTVENNNYFIPVNFEIDNRGNLIPGSFVEVFLISSEIENALIIPVSSLIEEQGLFYVYVQTGGESFQKREVKTGPGDGINIEIVSGVNEGERVVTKGAYNIKLAAMSGSIPDHGHEH